MAVRKSGDLTVRLTYHDDGTYKGSVTGPGGHFPFTDLRPPPVWEWEGMVYDSPRAYDEMARAAISFAGHYVEDIGYPDTDERGEAVLVTSAQRRRRALMNLKRARAARNPKV